MKWMVAIMLIVGTYAGTAWATDAQALYQKKCQTCHSLHGVGGKMAKLGGPLDDVGAKRDEAWLRAYLADPKSKMPKAKMPKTNLSGEDMDAMVKYLLTLKGPAPAK